MATIVFFAFQQSAMIDHLPESRYDLTSESPAQPKSVPAHYLTVKLKVMSSAFPDGNPMSMPRSQ